MTATFRKVPESKLGVSEPDPSWFGNSPNPKADKHWTNKNWLLSRFHFSFAEYHNPQNQNFGVLRVMNDDLVQPARGFGEHPHRDMEICTYIVEGELSHKDSMGTQETLGRGAVQFMTAGKGVAHSEHNLHKENPLRFIQIWISPRTTGLKPNYGSAAGDFERRHNAFAHLTSDIKSAHATPIKINQDANIYVAEIDAGVATDFPVGEGRQAYVLVMEGAATFSHAQGETVLDRHDAAEVKGLNHLNVKAHGALSAHVLIVEMALAAGSGRTDL